MDTHMAVQIFHSAFLVDENGVNPPPYTEISSDEIAEGKWKVSSWAINSTSLGDTRAPQEYLLHYARELEESGKYRLMVWPYHAMLGGIGHALVSAIEEAAFFHTIARGSQTRFVVKGNNPLTEHYSIFRPEVTEDTCGEQIASENEKLVSDLLEYDAVIIAGQAKSHCVAWTVSDFLEIIRNRDTDLARKIYLLEDCSSSVVVDGGADFTDHASEAFARFERAGMNIVRSSDPLPSWPGMTS
jgi:nicotinamidase-related amidase